MKRDILVALYSEDTFALSWMAMLMVRDWRTRVAIEAASAGELAAELSHKHLTINVLVVDLDLISNLRQVTAEIQRYAEIQNKDLKVIAVGSQMEPRFFKELPHSLIRGYLLKQEISTSLAWAITFATEGKQVFTPSALEGSWRANFPLEKTRLILNSRSYPGLTERQSEIARLAIIFSINRRDLADELKISDQWSYGVVSELYEQLGLGDILDKTQEFNSVLENDKVIKAHIEEIVEDLGTSRKARDLETLAFHLLTMPVIE